MNVICDRIERQILERRRIEGFSEIKNLCADLQTDMTEVLDKYLTRLCDDYEYKFHTKQEFIEAACNYCDREGWTRP